MLFILTGETQIGKTRWLSQLTDDLIHSGLICYGVLAPGVWTAHADEEKTRFEKLGIDNVLLPQKETVTFAIRRDIAESQGGGDAESQSAAAQLAWSIPDKAISRVNLHFDGIAAMNTNAFHAPTAFDVSGTCKSGVGVFPGVLVVDELGRLELQHEQGLSSAVSLLESGQSSLYEHALIVVREWLYETACQRFAPAWPEIVKVYPTAEDKKRIIEKILRD